MWRSLSRSQIAALIATLVDYGILIVWVEIIHQHYLQGVALGALGGAVINFFLNRHWSFEASRERLHPQALRYALVSLFSLILNTSGVYLLTEYAHVYYLLSQTFVSIILGLVWNYPLHRFFVYKKERYHEVRIHFAATQPENSPQNIDPRSSQSTPS